jgi:hypothetical protein
MKSCLTNVITYSAAISACVKRYGDVNADAYDDLYTPCSARGIVEAHAIQQMSPFTARCPNATAGNAGKASWDHTGYQAMPQQSTSGHAGVLHIMYGDVKAATYDELSTHRMDCGFVEARQQYPFTVSHPDATDAIADGNGTATWDYTGYQTMLQESTLRHYCRCGDVYADTYVDLNTPRTNCGLVEARRQHPSTVSHPDATDAIADSTGKTAWEHMGYQAMSQESTLEQAMASHRRYGDVNADTYDDLSTYRMDCGLVEARRQYPSTVSHPEATEAIAVRTGKATWDHNGYQAMLQESTLEHAMVFHRRYGDVCTDKYEAQASDGFKHLMYGDVNADTYDVPNTSRTDGGLVEAHATVKM